MNSYKILIFGGGGLLGNTLVRYFALDDKFKVFTTLRSSSIPSIYSNLSNVHFIKLVDIDNYQNIIDIFYKIKPDIIVNAIGLVKQEIEAVDPLYAIPINALFPHRLSKLCDLTKTRLIHFSTDCVFSGSKGMYTEDDFPDAEDLYGKSKLLGEVSSMNSITLRTSMVGHEISTSKSLLSWFLSQKNSVKGYRNAIFTGLPTIEIACFLKDYLIPNEKLNGLFHLSSEPISKYNLLLLIAKIYGKNIDIIPDDSLVIDRSLDSTLIRKKLNFQPESWEEMILRMYKFQ